METATDKVKDYAYLAEVSIDEWCDLPRELHEAMALSVRMKSGIGTADELMTRLVAYVRVTNLMGAGVRLSSLNRLFSDQARKFQTSVMELVLMLVRSGKLTQVAHKTNTVVMSPDLRTEVESGGVDHWLAYLSRAE